MSKKVPPLSLIAYTSMYVSTMPAASTLLSDGPARYPALSWT